MELSTIDGAGVLIESDWNLKECICHRCTPDCPRINRIRLEFKVDCHFDGVSGCMY